MADTPMTVVETARFLKDAKTLMSRIPPRPLPNGRGSERSRARQQAGCADAYDAVFSKAERNAMKRLVPVLVAGYPAKRRRPQ
jgi:hypothetical protein